MIEREIEDKGSRKFRRRGFCSFLDIQFFGQPRTEQLTLGGITHPSAAAPSFLLKFLSGLRRNKRVLVFLGKAIFFYKP